MPRTLRIVPVGVLFHILNRANAGATLFADAADYAAFERILAEATRRFNVRLLAYCIMPNHWHLVVMPCEEGELARFVHWITTTHARRWHLCRDTVGQGHLYKGSYKSFPVQNDSHLLTLCRYVERNPLRANLVERAEDWRWSSLWRFLHPNIVDGVPLLSPWPVDRPSDWIEIVNRAETAAEFSDLERSLRRGAPFGEESWRCRTANQLGLDATLRPRGRPKATP
jgi:putative transposase